MTAASTTRSEASARASAAGMVTLVVDGTSVTVPHGRTVLDACRAGGAVVPTLCHRDGLSEVGSCRLCLVEAEGIARPVPACATPAAHGMVIATATPALREHRRAVVELLLASGVHVCAFCPASGRCELQALRREVELDHLELRAPRRAPAVDASRARFAFDPARCVLCTRCVRACSELEGARSLIVAGRGARARLANDGGGRWATSPSCTDCGRCVAACPTGALFEKALAAGAALPPVSRAPPAVLPLGRVRIATLWLGGCSGCHMSLLDLDERLLELAPRIEIVTSPLSDGADAAAPVDLCLVEGAVSSADHLELLRRARARSRVLVAIGDCAVSGNVTALRDSAGGAAAVLRRVHGHEWSTCSYDLPALLETVRPVHEIVRVDHFEPGCPPPAAALAVLLSAAARSGEERLG